MRCRFSFFLLAVLLGGAMQACSTNPATGRSQLLLLSMEEETALGVEATPQMLNEYGGEVDSPELREYVAGIGTDLAQYVEEEYQDVAWEFFVLDSDVVNAFALPGGKVFMSRGLMMYLENEAELAAVLGHEIGHVTGRHANDRISRAMVLQGVATTAGVAAGEGAVAQAIPMVVGAAGQGYLLSFSRSQESEADALGMRYMVNARYDPMGMAEMLQVLIDVAGGGGGLEFFSTHPDPNRRKAEALELIESEYAYTQGNPEYDVHERRFERQAAPHLSALAQHGDRSVRLGVLGASWCAHCRGE